MVGLILQKYLSTKQQVSTLWTLLGAQRRCSDSLRGWTVKVLDISGGEIFYTHLDWPQGRQPLYTGYWVILGCTADRV